MKKFKKNFPPVLWAIVSIFEMILVAFFALTDLLPLNLLVALVLLLLLVAVLNGLLLLTPVRKNRKNAWKRVTGYLLSSVLILTSIAGTFYLNRTKIAIDNVTQKSDIVATLGVYTLADGGASEITELADGTFGFLETYDAERNTTAIEEINKKSGGELTKENLATINDLPAALYAGDVDAIVLDEAFITLLTDSEAELTEEAEGTEATAAGDYSDFEEKTQLVYEIPIYGEVVDEEEDTADKNLTNETFVVYISGSDTRNNKLTTSRSDVNIIAEVNPVTHEIIMINTPRDYYIGNPAGGGAKDKLTHLGIYGIDNSMRGLSDLYGVDVDYYVQINFNGFKELINQLGGITVESQYSFTSYIYGGTYSYTKGMNTLNADEALAFCRERYEVPGGDVTRGIHQMATIKAVINKVTSSETLLTNYNGLMTGLEGTFTTSFTSDEVSDLVKMQLEDNASWNIHSFSVQGTGDKNTTYSAPSTYCYVMNPDENLVNFAKDLLQRVSEGEVLTDEDVIYQ